MPLSTMVLNRVHRSGYPALSPERSLAAAEALEESGESPLAASVLRIHAEAMRAAGRDARMAKSFSGAHPSVPMVQVGAQAADVHDIDGLRRIGAELAG